jgi:hypothetical protein
MDSSYLLKTGQPEVGILEIAVGYIKNSTRRSGLCGPNVYSDGLGDPKEITRETTSSYKSAFHDHHLARRFGRRLCKLSGGHVAIKPALILMIGRVV